MARLVMSASEFVNRTAISVVAARRYSMSERDFPPRGRQPSSELEEVLGQVRQYWQGFRAGPIIGLGVLIVALIFLWSSWFTVQPEETGVVQRFGKIVRTQVSGNQAYKSESLMLTGDLNVIDVQWILQYRIEDPIRYLFQVRDAPKTIRDITEAVMRQVVGNRLGSDVLTVGRVAVSTAAKEEIQRILNIYETGVRLVTVELQDVTPPDPVKPAFNEVNESRQDRERTINQAQEQVNREIPKAGGEAARSISEAEGYAIERVNRARGEATRFQAILAEYQQAPEVTRRRLHLEAMGRFMTEMKGLYIVDSDQKAMVPWLSLESGPKESGPKPTAEGRSP
jgi:membrane protease subunit HflK